MGTGKGLLDSLIRGMVIEIRRARSDRNAVKFYIDGYPYFNFYLEEIFL